MVSGREDITHSFDTDSDSGTPESEWRAWGRTFPPLDLARCSKLVVVAPHPDDEVLGVGGLMSIAAAAGIEVSVIAVTDGGASHPGSPTLSPADLVSERPRESERAVARLGVRTAPIRLGFEDGAVAEHEDELAHALTDSLHGGPGTWCLTAWRGDGHPDHEATARACITAASRTGIAIFEYPIWMWHWGYPDHPDVPWSRAFEVDLGANAREAKEAAVQEFRTQIAPLSEHPADRAVLPPFALERLLRPREVIFG